MGAIIVRGVAIHHFQLCEFACKCTRCRSVQFGIEDIDPNLIIALEMARVSAGRAFVITSGARCPRHNQSVGGKRASSHLWMPEQGVVCRAVDGYFIGWGPRRSYCEMERWGFSGLGWYDRPGQGGFVHCDVNSARRSRWSDTGKGLEYFFTAIGDDR